MVNTQLLEEKIEKSGKKKSYLAEKCGLSDSGFRNCCNNKSEFKISHARVLCSELSVADWSEYKQIFFAQ